MRLVMEDDKAFELTIWGNFRAMEVAFDDGDDDMLLYHTKQFLFFRQIQNNNMDTESTQV